MQLLRKVLILWVSFLLLSASVALPAYAVDDIIPVAHDVSLEGNEVLIQNDIKVKDNEIEPLNTNSVKKTVVPSPKKEGRKVIDLFLKTMSAVVFCAVVLYVILIFVKRFYQSAFIDNDDRDIEGFDLTPPQNKHEALQSFLNRSK